MSDHGDERAGELPQQVEGGVLPNAVLPPQTQYLTHEEDLDADTMNVDADTMNVDADVDKLEQLELLVEVYQLM